MRAVDGGEDRVGQHVVGLVLRAVDLLEHHVHLACQLLRIEDRVLHRVGEDVDPHAELAGGEGGVVAGHVEGREGVDAAAHALHRARDLAHVAALGALEEHVLVEVGQALLAGALVRRAHVRPDLDLRHGRHVHLAEDEGEAVRERLEVDGGGQGGPRVTPGGPRAVRRDPTPGRPRSPRRPRGEAAGVLGAARSVSSPRARRDGRRLPPRALLRARLSLLRLRRGGPALALAGGGGAHRGGAPGGADAAPRRLRGLALASLYLGGGTPSLLRPASVARLIEAVRAAFPVRPAEPGAGGRPRTRWRSPWR